MEMNVNSEREKKEKKYRKRVEMWALIDVIIAVGLIAEVALLKGMGCHLGWPASLIFVVIVFLVLFPGILAALLYGRIKRCK